MKKCTDIIQHISVLCKRCKIELQANRFLTTATVRDVSKISNDLISVKEEGIFDSFEGRF